MLCNCNFVFMAVIDNSINLFTNAEGITMTKINKSICSVLKNNPNVLTFGTVKPFRRLLHRMITPKAE